MQMMQQMGSGGGGGGGFVFGMPATTAPSTNPSSTFPSTASSSPPTNPWASLTPTPATTPATAPSSTPVVDESSFTSQLDQLTNMGFSDRDQNLRALRATNGIVHTAVEKILNGI